MLVSYLCKKNYRFKHTCKDDNDIGHRKQQKLDYHIFISCLIHHNVSRSWHCNDETGNLHV